MRRLLSLVPVVALLALVPNAAAASGLPPGVHVDPGSPAGKQYVIPIVAARSETSGAASGSAAATNPPLFGVGVTPSGASASGASASGAAQPATGQPSKAATVPASRPHHKARPATAAARTASSDPAPAENAIRAAATATGAGGTAWLPLIAGGVVVLLVGGGGGLALRRRL